MNTQPATLLNIPSSRGPIATAFHAPPPGGPVVVMVGGGDGGLDGPADLYVPLADDLSAAGIGTLRLDFRIHQFPGPVEEGVHDVLAGLAHLVDGGVAACGLLGHSFGGAVVIEAAARERESGGGAVGSVATLATQTAGAQRVSELTPVPIFLIHGLADTRLPAECSTLLYERAGEPRRIELLEGATHSLRQRHTEVRSLLVDWFSSTLGVTARRAD